MSTNDPYPEPVKQAAEYARDELDNGFVPDPADFYENEAQWNARTNGSQKTYSGLGVFVDRDEHSETQGDEEWKVEVRMASHQSANPLPVADGLTAEEMQNVIRAFQYRLDWFVRHGEYEPSYERKD
ncbi:hypothetical protein [Haloarcula amylovorans]|uniref:hypothetical protein n=1 Tax=Haloarcula amylovorans TaxID=2562280 RepID=UPI001075F9CD|nr:hypothetical protein [Halomicroarcula amylolytica]